jgi:hypothetical protein
MMRDTAATIGMINKRRLAIFPRRVVSAVDHPVIVLPLPTGSISTRSILKSEHVILPDAFVLSSHGLSAKTEVITDPKKRKVLIRKERKNLIENV